MTRLRMTNFCVLAFCLLAALSPVCFAAEADSKEPFAIFHVGNSLTDQAYGMHDIAAARGQQTKFGRHMIPGAPLQWLWEHRSEGFRAPDAKQPADEILKNSKWGALILQPFGRGPENVAVHGVRIGSSSF